MAFLPIFLLILLCFEATIHIISGVLIYKRRSHKVFRVRAVVLLQISHWANFIETIIILYAVQEVSYNKVGYGWVLTLTSFVHFLNHYLFFIPFILRTYRLYLIFTIKKTQSSMKEAIFKLSKRSSQAWLIKVLVIITLPFLVVFWVGFVIYPTHYDLGDGEEDTSNGNYIAVHSISVFLTFIEQLVSIISIYSIRNLKDDYNMSKELLLINLTWVITSPNNIFGEYSVYAYQILLRNNLVLSINALYPLYKSRGTVEFDIPITEEILSGLLPLLNHEMSFGYFEAFLKKNLDHQHSGYPGIEFLKIWICCELLEFNPNNSVEIPEAKDALMLRDESLASIKAATFQVLDKHFFSVFLGSEEYAQCLKEINMMNIVEGRIYGENYRVMDSIRHKN